MAQLYTFHLFAGAGGGILADALLGHWPIGAVEIEPYPRSVLLARQRDGLLPPFPIWDDVRDFRSDNPDCAEYIDGLRAIREQLVICGGFPCPAYSSARRGAGNPPDLLPEFVRIVDEIRPARVFGENVSERAIRNAARDLRRLGYRCKGAEVSAAAVGAGHIRERWWILGDSDRDGKSDMREHGQMAGDFGDDAVAWFADDSPSRVGVSDGMADRMDRLAALGNGQIPSVAALAWEILTND